VIELPRGMTLEEVKAVLHAVGIPDRERLFYRLLYVTQFRPFELLGCDIEDWDRRNHYLTARVTKRKYNPRTKEVHTEPAKIMLLDSTSEALLSAVIGRRKQGAIFLNRSGDRISKRYMERRIDWLAVKLGVQQQLTATRKLVGLMALREAGERHHDMRGGDSDISAKAAQHSRAVKERHYKRTPTEEIAESYKKHHPAHTGDV